MVIDFFIHGTPAPAGSKTAIPMRRSNGDLVLTYKYSKRHSRKVPRPVLKYADSGGDRRRAWVEACKRAAAIHYRGRPLDVPLRVLFRFYVRRPKHHYIADDPRRPLKPTYEHLLHDPHPADSLKLRRSTEDALTGLLWRDDSLIVQGYDEKLYALASEPTGCRVMVTAVIPDHAPWSLFAQEACQS